MKEGIVLTFPGRGGTEIPLLYFCAKFFEDRGYDKIFVAQPPDNEEDFDKAYSHAKELLEGICFQEYRDIVFVGKSRGTVLACKLKERLKLPVSLILLTPIEATLPHMTYDNDILLAVCGSKDRHLSCELVREVCQRENIPCYIEEGVGHRMEVRADLDRNLEIIRNVMAVFYTLIKTSS